MALEKFRNASRSPIVVILLFFVALSFVIVGNVGDDIRLNTNRAVAVVGGEEIGINEFKRQYDNRAAQLSEQIGQPVTPDLAKQIGLVDQVIGGLVTRAAVRKHARSHGLGASDVAVKRELYKIEAFQGVGQRFDPEQYKRVLEVNGLNQVEFESGIRTDIIAQQMTEVISTGITPPKGLAEMIFRFQAESRGADYIILSPDLVGQIEAPEEDVLKEFYGLNSILFSVPEFRKVTYLQMSIDDFVDNVIVTDEDIAALYERREASYKVAESRMVKRIFGSEEDIRAAKARIDAGESFEEVGESMGFELKDIVLGSIKIGDITDPKAADAIFAMEAPGLSDPIEGALSWSLAEVTEIEPETITPLDAVKEELRNDIAQSSAIDLLFDALEVVEEDIASGTPVEDIASKLDLEAKVIERIDRQGQGPDGNAIAGIPEDPQFIDEIFSTVVGFEGDLLEMGENNFVSVRVDEIVETLVQPYDDVKEKVMTEWRRIERENRLEALASDLANRGNAGEDFAALGDEVGRGVLTVSTPIQRGDESEFISSEINRKIFLAQQGEFVFGAAASGDSLMVAKVTDISVPNAVAAGGVIDSFQDQIGQSMEDDIYQLYLTGLVNEYGQQRNEAAIDLALGVTTPTQ